MGWTQRLSVKNSWCEVALELLTWDILNGCTPGRDRPFFHYCFLFLFYFFLCVRVTSMSYQRFDSVLVNCAMHGCRELGLPYLSEDACQRCWISCPVVRGIGTSRSTGEACAFTFFERPATASLFPARIGLQYGGKSTSNFVQWLNWIVFSSYQSTLCLCYVPAHAILEVVFAARTARKGTKRPCGWWMISASLFTRFFPSGKSAPRVHGATLCLVVSLAKGVVALVRDERSYNSTTWFQKHGKHDLIYDSVRDDSKHRLEKLGRSVSETGTGASEMTRSTRTCLEPAPLRACASWVAPLPWLHDAAARAPATASQAVPLLIDLGWGPDSEWRWVLVTQGRVFHMFHFQFSFSSRFEEGKASKPGWDNQARFLSYKFLSNRALCSLRCDLSKKKLMIGSILKFLGWMLFGSKLVAVQMW